MDPDGYYATGSELFVLESTFAGPKVSFLDHGGHTWDHAYSLTELAVVGLPGGPEPDGLVVIDINAIEAIGEDQVDPCGPGDYNCNGVVDAADYTVWRDGLGTTFVQADYDVWVANFGAVLPPPPSNTIPEPAGLLLIAVILGAAPRRLRR